MPKTEMVITIRKEWDSDGPADQFDVFHRVVDSVQRSGATVNVELEDRADSAPARRRRRATNGTEPGTPSVQQEPVRAPTPPAPQAPPVKPTPAPLDLSGDDTPQDEGEDDLGLGSSPTKTSEEAYEAARGGLINLYNAGHKPQVRTLMKGWGVAKFDELDAAKDGHKCYKDVAQMLETVGMHI